MNHERWLVSYADFITLMFAFFVVMFASSQTDKAKAKQVSESVQQALEEGRVMESVIKVLGGRINNGGRTVSRPPAPPVPSGAESRCRSAAFAGVPLDRVEKRNCGREAANSPGAAWPDCQPHSGSVFLLGRRRHRCGYLWQHCHHRGGHPKTAESRPSRGPHRFDTDTQRPFSEQLGAFLRSRHRYARVC